MVFTRLYGGMGNQMFQYAFSRKLQIKYGGDLVLDVSDGTEYASTEADKHRKSVLSEFSLPQNNIVFIDNKKTFERCAGRGIKYADLLDRLPRAIRKITKDNQLYRKSVRLIQKQFNCRGYFTAFDSFSEPDYPEIIDNCYVNGLFSSKKYFDDIYMELKKEFQPNHEPNDINKKYLNDILNSQSVCMHVRKGSSYVNNPYLNVCTGGYFEKAMDLIERKYPKAVFYVFSNDIKWCRENINFGKHKYHLVKANDGQHAVDELRLMTSCNHFILSNSTMGWWAQYLCDYSDRMVISPNTWAKGKISLLSDLIEDNWILIEV